jgi:hypothetical protein
MVEDYTVDSLISFNEGDDKESPERVIMESDFVRAFEDLLYKRIPGNFLVIEADGRYIHFWIDDLYGEVYSEAAGNEQLPEIYHLGRDQNAAMNLLGFESPGKLSPNYIRKWGSPEYFSPSVAASTALQVLREIYGASDNDITIIRGKD